MSDEESTRRIDMSALRSVTGEGATANPDEESLGHAPHSEETSITASITKAIALERPPSSRVGPPATIPGTIERPPSSIDTPDTSSSESTSITQMDPPIEDEQSEIPTNDANAAAEAQRLLAETTHHDNGSASLERLAQTEESTSLRIDGAEIDAMRERLGSLPRYSLHDDDDGGTELLARPEGLVESDSDTSAKIERPPVPNFDDVETTITQLGDDLAASLPVPTDDAPFHPADVPEETRSGRLGREEVKAAFEAAAALEAAALANVPVEEVEEVDAIALESVDDVLEDDEVDAIELDDDDISVDTGTGALTQVLKKPDEPRPGSASDLRNVVRSSVAPGPTGYTPPTPAKPLIPAYAMDPDADELQLQNERSFDALLSLYRLRIENAQSPSQKATLLHKIGSIHEWEHADADAAFQALLEAFELRPVDEELAQSLDRVAKHAGRVTEVVERAKKTIVNADHETRISLLGHLVYWHERLLGRPGDASVWVAELERTDKSHPVSLRRAAQQAAQKGDTKTQRELLLRALERAFRRDERVALHLQLASAFTGTPEAAKHYDAAIAIDGTSIVALQGIARLGREQGKHAQVEWALQQQVEVAETESERVNALLDLGELQETKFLRRERAAEIFETVLSLEPTNPTAMKALERCYHATRAWPQLAQVLRRRAQSTYDVREQIELLETAAEVYESKLSDPANAIEVHREILQADPKHRRALADLARLYEKIGDWGNVAIYKAQAAELAPTKRQASQLLVQLGDQLMAPDRDPIAGQLQYERASVIDPGNAAAWEALQKIAAAAGDDRRVAECLDARVRAVDGPRQRAAVLVELARFRDTNGDARGARAAWEQAIQSDPTNEAAATVLLETWVAEEKWAAAAPLCELLVNAAVRDHDEEALFTRVRLQTRIAAALGDVDKAMSAALAAIDARPDDPDAHADLIAVCSQVRESPKVIARAKDHLARIAASGRDLQGDMVVKLAQLQRDVGNVEEAQGMLERAARAEPDAVGVKMELAELYLANKDYPRACKLKIELARETLSPDEKMKLLREAGEIWADRAGEPTFAAQVFEEALQSAPEDAWLLHRLMGLYTELQRWDLLVGVLERVVATSASEGDARKAASLHTLAQVVRDKLGDYGRGADLLDQVLDLDRKRLDVFEELVRTLGDAKDWTRLEIAYQRMIARTDAEEDPNLAFALYHQLGLLYRDRIEDAEAAFNALDAAARIRPEDGEVRRAVNEILVVTDNLDNAVARTREALEQNPHDPEIYAELYDLFLRQHNFDKAWCAVNILAGMQPASPEQVQFHEDYAPMRLAEVPGQIVEHAWRSHLLHAELDPTLSQLFALMTPAVARMRHASLPQNQSMSRPFTPAHSRLYDMIRTTFANAAEILGIPNPELLLGEPSSPIAFGAAFVPFGGVLVAPQTVEGRSDALVYMTGKRLAEQRPELYARAYFSAPDLQTLLGAAVRVSRHEGAKDTAATALDQKLSAMMAPHERDGIRNIVMQRMDAVGGADVKRWSQLADLSSMRAGLLLSGDVDAARRTILAEPQSPSDLTPREKIGELYKFAMSDIYSDLRGAIGVAVTT